jgi:hypothetical protein
MTHTPKAYVISRLKLERVKNNLCDAHNSVASRDVSAPQGDRTCFRTTVWEPPRFPAPPNRPDRMHPAAAGLSTATQHPPAGVMLSTHSRAADAKRPAGSDRPVKGRFAHSLWQPSPPMVLEHYQVVIRFKRRGVAGLPSSTECCFCATRRPIIARAQCLISHRSKAQAQYPCLTSCLPDVGPCKTKAPSRYTQPAGGFLFRALPVSGWIRRRRPIGDEQRLLRRVQLARETAPATATAEPEASAASNSERSFSFSCRGQS